MKGSRTHLVLGIPTVCRRHDYVQQTVRQLLEHGGEALGDRAHVVLMNAEDPPEAHEAIAEIRAEHGEAIRSGALRVTVLAATAPTGASQNSEASTPEAWQRKQVIDAATLMETCAPLGSHYLRLEDDVAPAPGYLERPLDFLHEQEKVGGWHALAFYSPNPVSHGQAIDLREYWGFIGVLFRTSDLPPLVAALRRRCDENPVDHLVRRYLHENGLELRAHAPSLFEHVGYHSSLSRRIQSDRAWRFAGDRTPLHRALRILRRWVSVRWLRWTSRK